MQTNGAEADGKAVWSWHPLLVSSRRRFCEPDRVRQNRSFADDGDKTNSSPGSNCVWSRPVIGRPQGWRCAPPPPAA